MIPFPYQTGQLGRRAVPQQANPFPTSGLISYWGFDDGTGATANDDFGSNDATLVNSPTWSTDEKLGTNAIDFTGATNRAVTTGISFNATNNLTIGCWAKRTGTNDSRVAWGWRNAVSVTFLLIHRTDRGGLTIQANTGPSGTTFFDSGVSMAVGTYYLIGLSKSGNTFRVWVDGVDEGSGSLTFSSVSADLVIGNRSTTDLAWDGIIDEPFLFNRALTASEWLDIYNSGAGRKP